MTESLPYMPFYIDDYESHTPHLTILEDGAYNRLLRLCWRSSNCSIPNDPEWIRRKMRASEAELYDLIMPLINEFFTDKNGRVFQKRQKEIFLKINSTISERKKAGKKGGDSKALNNKKKASSNTTDLLLAKSYQMSSNQSQSQTKRKKEIKKDLLTDLLEEEFDQFWKTCLRKDAKAQSFINYKKARKKSSKEIIHNSMIAYSQKCEAEKTETRYIKKPNNWLTAEMYLDPIEINGHDYLNVTDSEWCARVKAFKNIGRWYDEWGPEPDQRKNHVPKNLQISSNL